MSRFYFHILDGGHIIPDDEGMELSGLLAAQAEALASVRDLALAGTGRCIVQIANAAGEVLDSVAFLGH